MKRAQVISMDFVMTFAIYLLALSVFFFALKGNFTDSTSLDVNAELIFNKLTNAYDLETDILDGAKVSNLDQFQGVGYDPHDGYRIFFRDFESANFKKIDYCVFLQDKEDIVFHFEAYKDDFSLSDYSIFLGGSKCGEDPMFRSSVTPSCKAEESIILEKPVLYDGKIMKLKVLACAE